MQQIVRNPSNRVLYFSFVIKADTAKATPQISTQRYASIFMTVATVSERPTARQMIETVLPVPVVEKEKILPKYLI